MSERGVSESTQWALLIPVVMLVVLGTIQAGIWLYARTVAGQAAGADRVDVAHVGTAAVAHQLFRPAGLDPGVGLGDPLGPRPSRFGLSHRLPLAKAGELNAGRGQSRTRRNLPHPTRRTPGAEPPRLWHTAAMHALPHLSLVDWLALAVYFACWIGYGWYSEHSRWRHDGLIGQSHEYRLQWAYRLLERDVRVMDSTLIGNLMTSVSFYANTTIYIIAGLIAALGAADKLVTVAADLPFGRLGSQHLLEMKLILLLGSFVFAYFKFTWSLRQFNLLSILVGAAPHGKAGEPGIDAYAHRVAGTNSLAGDDFNRGIRAYYFGLAAIAWFLNAWALIIASLWVTWVLYRREFHSPMLQELLRAADEAPPP